MGFTVVSAVTVVSILLVVLLTKVVSDTETSAVFETTDVLISLFAFSSAVQAVNVPAAKINVNIIAIFFFMLSPSFQATSISKDFEMSREFYYILCKKFSDSSSDIFSVSDSACCSSSD